LIELIERVEQIVPACLIRGSSGARELQLPTEIREAAFHFPLQGFQPKAEFGLRAS
jgi:hypothetical protein